MTLIGILKKKLMGVEAIFRDYEIPQKSYINPQIDSKSIIKNKIYKNVKRSCTFLQNYFNIQVLKRESLSKTLQLFATNNENRQVFIKLFLDPVQKEISKDNITYPVYIRDNSLMIEVCIYSCIIPILSEYNTPFVINFIEHQICSIKDQDEKFSILNQGIQDLINWDYEEIYNHEKFHLLITERISNFIPFYEWLESQHNINEYKIIFFQIYWSLACFSKIKLKHNDLHFNNILIETEPEPSLYYFEIKSRGKTRIIKLETRYRVRIFDWDNSSFGNLIRNTGLTDLVDIYINPGYDVYILSCRINKIMDVISKNLTQIEIEEITNFLNYFSNYKRIDNDKIIETIVPKLNKESLDLLKIDPDHPKIKRAKKISEDCQPRQKTYPDGIFEDSKESDKWEYTKGNIIYLDYDLPQFLIDTPFFANYEILQRPQNIKIFELPSTNEENFMSESIKTNFPGLLSENVEEYNEE